MLPAVFLHAFTLLEHLNFICCTKEKNQNFFVTVLEDKQSNGYAALVNSRKGFEEVLLRAEDVSSAKGTSVLKKIHNIICERFNCMAYYVANEALSHDIALVEQKHTQARDPSASLNWLMLISNH